MVKPLLPKATAVWLIENTSLTFEQIADFCGFHTLEIQGIADGDVAKHIMGSNPIEMGQLTKEEIARCEGDSRAKLQLTDATLSIIVGEQIKRKKGSKYTPVARRQDKPDAIAWIIKHYPDMTDLQIAKLVGSKRDVVTSIRDKSHWNYSNISPKDPVLLGLCSQTEFNQFTQGMVRK